MSVPVSERKQSNMEFLKNAHDIKNCAIRRARKLPKSRQHFMWKTGVNREFREPVKVPFS